MSGCRVEQLCLLLASFTTYNLSTRALGTIHSKNDLAIVSQYEPQNMSGCRVEHVFVTCFFYNNLSTRAGNNRGPAGHEAQSPPAYHRVLTNIADKGRGNRDGFSSGMKIAASPNETQAAAPHLGIGRAHACWAGINTSR
jgi:hypothetical protein